MMLLLGMRKWDAMGSVEGGCLNIPIVWINETYLIWGSRVQNLPGLIKEISPV